ncbi:MAG: leucine-rich repeat protein [Clostridia bacterium]
MKYTIEQSDNGTRVLTRCEGDFVKELPYLLTKVDAIGPRCVDGFSGLKEVVIPKHIKYIGEYAFGCCGIEKVVFENDAIKIDRGAFSNNKITEIDLPAKGMIYPNAFSYNKIEHLFIPKNCTLVNSAFREMPHLKSVEIEEGFNGVTSEMFVMCQSLQQVKLPSSIKNIGEQMFANCKSLQSIEIPEGVESIGDYAFGGCIELKQVKLPTTLRNIDSEAFMHCKGIKSITIPKGCEFNPDAIEHGVKINVVDYKEQRIIKNLIDFFSKTTTINDLNSEEVVDWLQKYEVKDSCEEIQEETLNQ